MDKIGKPLNILLVEDNKFDRDFFKISFESSTLESNITECINAEDALRQLALDQSAFDVVVVDHTLPGMTGLRLAEKILAEGYNLPILLITGTGSEEVAVEAMQVGVDDYIIKGSEVHRKILPQLVERAVKKFTNRLELEKTQKSLKESEEKFRSVTESANDAIISIDDDGNIISWNIGAVNHFGYKAEEIIGESVMLLVPERYSMAHLKGVKKTLKKGGLTFKDHKTFDVFAMCKDGKELSVEISLSSWAIGRRIYFSAIIRDVTARVSAESRLKKLNNAIEQSPEMVMITDMKGTIEYVNPAVTHVTGYTRNEIIGKNSSILKSGVHTPEFYKSMWADIANGKRWHGVMVNRKKSGELYHEEMSISPVKDDMGTVTHYVAIKSDITERKEMEAALAERERRLRDIIETTSEGYWQINLDGVTTDVNGSLCEMLGYSREEMMGKHTSFFTDEENRKIMAAQTAKIATTLHRHFEVTLKAKDGKDVPVVFNATTFNDEVGNPVGGFSFVRDISEQKVNEEAITKAKNDAEEATRLKDKFVSLVSHDLKNPISRLMLYLDMLKATEQLSNHGKEMIEEGVETLDEMTSLINDVLNLTRIRGARMMPAYALFHPHAIAELAIKNYHRLADDKGVELINEIPEKGKIFADERLILEVLRNLISNAVKFCRKGCMVRIYVPDGEKNTIVVSDTGVGIKPEKMDALFKYEQRTSTKGTSGESGTGLGLPLCLDIVEAHGGRLDIESDVGKGSNFYIKLPEIKPRVLIVDDDESVRKLFIERLKKMDIVIMEADNGEAALELIKTKRPQLFFLDLHMPGMSGLELLKHIKEDPDTEKIPVIVVTADKTMEVVDHAFMEGADDFIVKPFEKADLIENVKRFIG